MFTPYSSSTPLGQLTDVSAQDLIPIDEFGIPVAAASLLAAASPRTARAVKQWLLRNAEAPATAFNGLNGQAYRLGVLPKAWHGRPLRAWMNEQRQVQSDASELTLRGARLAPGVQIYAEPALDCVDAQSVLCVTPHGRDEPVGYATVKVSVRIPRVVQLGGMLRVPDNFDEFHDLREPQVELKVVLDEVFVLPDHRGNGLGHALAQAVQANIIELTRALEFLMAHAPLTLDLDAEVVSFAGAHYVNRVRELLCENLVGEQAGWSLEAYGYPLEYRKGQLALHLRHDFC